VGPPQHCWTRLTGDMTHVLLHLLLGACSSGYRFVHLFTGLHDRRLQVRILPYSPSRA
jgi:hypothetical protein